MYNTAIVALQALEDHIMRGCVSSDLSHSYADAASTLAVSASDYFYFLSFMLTQAWFSIWIASTACKIFCLLWLF